MQNSILSLPIVTLLWKHWTLPIISMGSLLKYQLWNRLYFLCLHLPYILWWHRKNTFIVYPRFVQIDWKSPQKQICPIHLFHIVQMSRLVFLDIWEAKPHNRSTLNEKIFFYKMTKDLQFSSNLWKHFFFIVAIYRLDFVFALVEFFFKLNINSHIFQFF